MQSFIRRKEGRKERKAGLTLIEIGIVIAVFALILIGILTALGVANQSREMSGLSGDLSNIRSAITKWSAGGPVNITKNVGTATAPVFKNFGLSKFSQIAVLLPTPLRGAADKASATLTGANPWGGNYVLTTSKTTPWKYTIQITDVDTDLIPIVTNQLARGDGTVTTTSMSITIVYEN